MRMRRTQTLHFSFNLTLRFSLKMAKIEKNIFKEKLQLSGCPNMLKSTLYLLCSFRITFSCILPIFGAKQVVVTGQKVRIKISHIVSYPHGSWTSYCNKILVTALPSFAAQVTKGISQKKFTQIFKFSCFSRYHAHIFYDN